MRNLEMLIVAGVAMLLMCCQRGEGRSNTQPPCTAAKSCTLQLDRTGLPTCDARERIPQHVSMLFAAGHGGMRKSVGRALPEKGVKSI